MVYKIKNNRQMIKKSSFENVKVNIPVRVRYIGKHELVFTGYNREIHGDAIELVGDKLYVYNDVLDYKTTIDIKTITELTCYSAGIRDRSYYLFLEIEKHLNIDKHIVNPSLITNQKTNKMKKFWFIVGIVLATISLIMIINKHVCNNDNVVKTLPIPNVQNIDTIPSTVKEEKK
jgi:hypothetical protein